MILLTFFFVSTLPATALPPSAATRAMIASSIAGEGRRAPVFMLLPSFIRRSGRAAPAARTPMT
jgi:hypothetical protein